jgi:uncharacterized protein YjbI with pentapeptide repeats
MTMFALLLWAPDIGAAQRRIDSAEELITRILEEWKRVEAKAQENKELADWKRKDYTHARLNELRLDGTLLTKALSDDRLNHVGAIWLHKSEISGGLDFRDIPETPLALVDLPAHWSEDLRQTWVTHAKAAGISGLHVVRPALRFTETIFLWSRGQYLSLNAPQTLFKGKLELRNITIGREGDYGEKDFRGAIFSGNVEFDHVTLSGLCNMSGAIAAGEFRFSNINAGGLSFERMRFERKASFAHLSANLNYQDAIFEREASFSGDIQGVRNSRTDLSAPVKLIRTRFRGPAFFREATVTGTVDMTEAVFEELASLQGSRFLESLKLTSVTFRGFLDFRAARIQELYFRNDALTLVEGRGDFRNAEIANLRFKDVVFTHDVDFSDATLGASPTMKERGTSQAPHAEEASADAVDGKEEIGTTSLRFVTFEGNAYFLRTKFFGKIYFEDVSFQKMADFTEARLPSRDHESQVFLFSFVRFAELLLRWRQLPPTSQWIDFEDVAPGHPEDRGARVEPLSHVLRKFEASFRARNLLADANEAHLSAKLVELAEARRQKTVRQRLGIEAEWLFWGIPCGYGTRIWRILGSASVICLLFALVFAKCGVQRRLFPENTSEFDLRLRLLDIPRQYLASPLAAPAASAPVEGASETIAEKGSRLVDALRFSAVLLFKIGYRDTIISGKVGPLDVKYLVIFEWALGFYFLAAITVTLTNTQPLINKLISGLF